MVYAWLAAFLIPLFVYSNALAKKHATLGVPPELIGTPESLAEESLKTFEYDLIRPKNNRELQQLVCAGALVSLRMPDDNPTFSMSVQKRFRYARPWTVEYIHDFSLRYFQRFGKLPKVAGLVRTEAYQNHLVRQKKSTADCSTLERCSSHPTGFTVDFSRLGMSKEELAWVRAEFAYGEQEGLILATEEVYDTTNTFHVMVLPDYSGIQDVKPDRELIKESGCDKPKPKAKKPKS